MEVVVVGAGVAGLGIGWRLAQAGAAVTVLERAQVGNGATAASAGMIAAGAELGAAETPETAFARHSETLWPAFAEEIEAQSGVKIGFRRDGSLIVAMREEPPGFGGDAMLGAAEARVLEPLLSEDIAGAAWAPDDAVVDSQALCRALAVAFVRAGGKVLSNETAVRIDSEGGRATGVVTPFAMHHADAYVLAAGAWTSRIEGLRPELVPPVIPVKGEILVLSPPQGAEMPRHVVWGNGIYVVPRGNRLLLGATVEQAGFDTSLTQHAYRWLRRQSAGLMPSLDTWRTAAHWAGLRPATPDGMPILGETALEGLYVASGQHRNGILFAPAVAELMARLVLDRAINVPAFDPGRFGGGRAPASASVVETPHKERGKGEWSTGS